MKKGKKYSHPHWYKNFCIWVSKHAVQLYWIQSATQNVSLKWITDDWIFIPHRKVRFSNESILFTIHFSFNILVLKRPFCNRFVRNWDLLRKIISTFIVSKQSKEASHRKKMTYDQSQKLISNTLHKKKFAREKNFCSQNSMDEQ